MNKDLTTVVEWLKGNKLSLNVAKTRAMVISTKQKEMGLTRNNEELSLKIQEEPIDNGLMTKYFDIQVDSGEARMKKLVLPLWNERKTHKRGSQKFS